MGKLIGALDISCKWEVKELGLFGLHKAYKCALCRNRDRNLVVGMRQIND